MKSLKEYIKGNTAWIFTVIKPGSLDLTTDVVKEFAKEGWKVWRTRPKRLLPSEARRLYRVHRNEDFYNDLCKYMASDVSRAIIFKKDEPMSNDIFDQVKAIKDKIREKYGESEMRNVLHSSDSVENMEREASIYFEL